VNERQAFLDALEANEDDTPTRMVYADWLDDQGEHEEADRQRKWPAAKEWLVRFCAKNKSESEDDPGAWVISYEELLELGQGALEQADKYGIAIHCGNNMEMMEALQASCGEFWENFSIVTGIPLPPDVEEKSSFRCAC
jgi:uncharacterized protein (TIGR02996 family)